MGCLTTHVLDTAKGIAASGLKIELFRVGETALLRELITNEDGRADSPVLDQDSFIPGIYELHFHAGEYLRAGGAVLSDPAFLDLVVIRFGIADADQHYHVPLLLSPFGYSTYRGS